MNAHSASVPRVAFRFWLVLPFFLIALWEPVLAQPHGQWAWIGGSSTVSHPYAGQPGVYGTENQFAAANTPGGRYSPAIWTGLDGRLWLFGGNGSDSAGIAGMLNDLWVFDPGQGAQGEWAWMGGGNAKPASCGFCGPMGAYGTEYQFSAGNFPGARAWAAQWVDENGRFWLFGGYGVDGSGNIGFLNDLWVFDTVQGADGEWAWMGGSGNVPKSPYGGQPGVYGAEYQFAAAQNPGGRAAPVSWTSPSGKLWLFGGEDSDSSGNAEILNDLWAFDPAQGAHGEWAWMGGDNPEGTRGGQPGVYGTQNQFSTSNIPAGRWTATSWAGPDGRIWLSGGEGYGSTGRFGWFSDLWVFDPSQGAHGEWAWMGGNSNTIDQAGAYGDALQYAASDAPGGRNEASSWADPGGRLWLFGGNGLDATGTGDYLNDLWVFDPSQGADGEWAWVGGSKTTGPDYHPPGNYGAEYQFSDGNAPGGRAGAAVWSGQTGQEWLFGGFGADAAGIPGNLNDLWQYQLYLDQPQEITFTASASTVTYGSGPITLSATASSSLPVTVSLVSGPAQFSKASKPIISITAPGTVVVTASQPGNLFYAAASQVTLVIVVNPAPLTVRASSFTITYGAAVPALTWSAAGFVPGDTIANSLTGQPALATTAASASLPGSYPITIGPGSLASQKYSFNFSNGVIKVLALGTVATPTLSLKTGTYATAQSVAISCPAQNAAIWYSTDGSTPVPGAGSAVLYSGAPIQINQTTTLRAVAALNGWTTSSPASAVYTLQAAAPTVNLASRAYNTPQQVSISDSMPDAVIWYTLDGSRPVPGAGSAIQYNATPIQINRTTTLETVATVPGWANSLPTARVYTLMAGGPTFSPRAGTYKVAQSVAISDSTPNAVIWYTTDGSSPVPGAGTATQYKGKSVAIIATTTLNAVAAVSGWSNSLIASAAYTIQ